MPAEYFYLGPPKSFSNEAAQAFAEEDPLAQLRPVANFSEVIRSVENRSASYGVLPVENSVSSSVHETMDLLFQSPLFIVQELYLRIQLHMFRRVDDSHEEILAIHSHPKAFEQIRGFLARHPRIACIPESSTAAAAEAVASGLTPGHVFLGSQSFQSDARFQELQEVSSEARSNCTRFVLVSQERGGLSQAKSVAETAVLKASVVFRARHEPASLLKVLEGLSALQANLTRIESRPIPDTQLEYFFWVDYECEPSKLDATFSSLRKTCVEYTVRGVFPRAEWPESVRR